MKRFLSIILTIVMIASMMNIAAFAAVLPDDAAYIKTVDDGDASKFSNTGFTVTSAVPGSAGKDATDLGFSYSTTVSTSYSSLGAPKEALITNVGDTIDYEKEYNFLVIEFNIKPTGNTGFTLASLGGIGNLNVDAVPYSALNQDKWNKVYIYFDYTKVEGDYYKNNEQDILDKSAEGNFSEVYDEATIDKLAPYGYVYINGAQYGNARQVNRLRDLIGIGIKHHAKNTSTYTDNTGKVTRFFLTGGLSATFDDVSIYYTNTAPDGEASSKPFELTGNSKYNVTDKTVIPLTNISASSVAADLQGANVRAYTDSFLSTPLSDTTTLEEGNMIVVEKDAKYTYYTVGTPVVEGITNLASEKTCFYPANAPFSMSGTSGKNTTHVTGKFGKDATDSSALLTVNDDYNEYNWHYIYNHGEHIYWNNGKDYSGKLVVDFNFMVDDSSSDEHFIRLGLSGKQYSVGGDIYPTKATSYKSNQWNHVRMIYDPTDHGDFGSVWTNNNNGTTGYTNTSVAAGTKLGTFTTYLNGEVFQAEKEVTATSSDTVSSGTFASGASNIYIMGHSGRNCPSKTYLDDVKIYIADEIGAPVMPALTSNDKFTVSGGSIVPSGTLTPADIAAVAGDAKVGAYADSKYKYPVASGDALLEGDTVVVAKDSMYSYYTVGASDQITYLRTMTDGALVNLSYSKTKMTATAESGSKGKASDDKVLAVTTVSGSDPYIFGGGAMATTDGKTYIPYYVVKFNIMPENDSYFVLRSKNNKEIITTVPATSLNQGRWNSVMIYLDYTQIDPDFDYTDLLAENKEFAENGNWAAHYVSDDILTRIAPTGHVFVNGEEIGEGLTLTSKRLMDRYGMINTYYNSEAELTTQNNTDWRLALLPNSGGSTVSLDDLYIYQTDKLPDAAAETTFSPITASADLIIDGNVAKVSVGNSVNTLKEKNPRYDFIAYTDSTLNSEYDSSVALDDGCVLAVTDRKGVIAYFDVEINDNSTTLYEDKAYADFDAFTTATSSEITGVAGKASTDSSLKVVTTGTSSALSYAYNDADFEGYIVNEFNIINNGATKIFVGTADGEEISSDLTNRLSDGIWNRVKVVTDRTGGDNDGKSITYVNGVAVSNWEDDAFTNVFNYYFEAPAGSGIYLDDLRIYQISAISETKPVTLSGDSFVAAGPNFNIIKETKLSDIASAKYQVAGYTDATLSTPLASDAVIAPGNVIVISDRYNTMTYFTARIWTGVTDVITETPDSVVGGTATATAAPVLGKTGTDTSYAVTAGSYYNIEWSALDPLSKYLVYEVLVAPNGGTVTFATDNDIAMSPALDESFGVVANRWNKIVNVYNIESGCSDTYVNGVKTSVEFKTKYKNEPVRDTLKLIISNASYVDDMKIYESVLYPEFDDVYEIEDGFNNEKAYVIDADAKTITLKPCTAGTLASYFAKDGVSISVYGDDSFGALLSSNDTFSEGAVVVIVTDDGVYTYYNVCDYEWDDIFIMGKMYDAEKNALYGKGAETFIAPVTNGGVLYVAQYDKDGNLIKIEMDKDAVNGCLFAEFEPLNVVDSSVKAFLFEDTNTLKPLCENKEYSRIIGANILVIGNSFSIDLCTYLRPISEAAGIDYNVFVYDWGGRSINDHYNHWDDTKEELQEFVTTNKTSSPALYKNLGGSAGSYAGWTYVSIKDSLEMFEYDYIVLQNWGSSTSFYANTDANYEKNWYNMVSLAKHIHDIQPDAELMIHNTWSFETGNGSFATEEIRDSVSEEITQLNTRCATEAAELIGLDKPLRLVDSNKAFNTARAYVNEDGLDVFNTTFDSNKHAFYLGTDIPTVSVYDGTTVEPSEEERDNYYYILCDADQAAGRIGLHRDGYHANPAARYLIACNFFDMLSEGKVSGNTYRPGSATLQCSNYTSDDPDADLNDERSSVVRKKYDPLSEEVVILLQQIADGIER